MSECVPAAARSATAGVRSRIDQTWYMYIVISKPNR